MPENDHATDSNTDDRSRAVEDLAARVDRLESRLDETRRRVDAERDRVGHTGHGSGDAGHEGDRTETNGSRARTRTTRRGVLAAGGVLAALGLGSVPAAADPQGQVGTESDPLERLYVRDVLASGTIGTPSTPITATAARLNTTKFVTSESELRSAVGSHARIVLADDIEVTSEFKPDMATESTRDVHLDLNNYTLTRSDSFSPPGRLFNPVNCRHVTVTNGVVDGNRRNQTWFPAEKKHDLAVECDPSLDGRVVFDYHHRDNTQFATSVTDAFQVVATPRYSLDGMLSGWTESDIRFCDGLHTYDVDRQYLNPGPITSGDDAVAVTADTRSIEDVRIDGGPLSSPEHASGVKLYVRDRASAGTRYENVDVDATVDGANNGVVFSAPPDVTVRNLSVGGLLTNLDQDGVWLDGAVETFTFTGVIEDADQHGINARAGLRSGEISGVIQNWQEMGVWIDRGPGAVGDVVVDASLDGRGRGYRGVQVHNGGHVSISGTIGNVRNTGVHGEGTSANPCEYVTVSGATIHDCGAFPVRSRDNCDFWTVVGNGGNNAGTQPRLNGSNNVVANNNFN